MMEQIKWEDLYIKDFGGSQITSRVELTKAQRKMKTFYDEFLLPLYKPIKNTNFKFSVRNDKLTCRIMYKDLMKYYHFNSIREFLYEVANVKEGFTKEKADKLVEVMIRKKGV